MNNRDSNSATPPNEELVAYLDGELDAAGVRRIEALLAADPEVRRRLQSLERTWDLLDELDETPTGEPFTRSTLEMVAVAAREDLEQHDRVPRRRWGLFGVLLVAAAAVGFGVWAAAETFGDKDRRLLENLAVLENFDEYRQVRSIGYLYKLREAGLFTEPATETAKEGGSLQSETSPTADVHAESLAARRRRIEAMPVERKRELRRAEERFFSFSPEEQQELRQLDDDLRQAADGPQLRQIMQAYSKWASELAPISRTALADMSLDARVAWVKKRIELERKREADRPPNMEDLRKIGDWFTGFIKKNQKEIMATLSEQQRHEVAKARNETMRLFFMWGYAGKRWQMAKPPKLPPPMQESDLAELLKELSPDVQQRLAGRSPIDQWRQIESWMHRPMGRYQPHRPGPVSQDDDEQLAQFFEKLGDEERDSLLTMPSEEMQQALQRLYLLRKLKPNGRPGERGP